jgi:hypothetical protein
MIGNLILMADIVSRSHSINMLILFFITRIDEIIIVMAKIHIIILAYLATGSDTLVCDNWLFIVIDVIM